MEGEPQLSSPSDATQSKSNTQSSFADLADELCPYYMSIGVPYNEYWHGDYTQLAYYHKAHKLTMERKNYIAWLQGAYIYDALCAVSPVLHAFAKGGTKPLPYLEEPYKIKEEKDPETVRAEFLARWKANKAKWQSMHGKPSAVERHSVTKGGETDGADDRRITS